MSLSGSIDPIPGWPLYGVTLVIDDGRVYLNNTANFQYIILNTEGKTVVGPNRVSLTSEQYTAWADDDLVVLDYCAKNLNLTLNPSLEELIKIRDAPVENENENVVEEKVGN